MQNQKINLGNKVMVSDPCYGLGTWCQGVLENVKEGEYITSYTRMEEDTSRIASIVVVCAENANDNLEYEREEFEVGVDSGQAGIFDYEYYKKYHSDSNESDHCDDRWYDMVCDKTYGCYKNEAYVPFTQTNEYKAALLNFNNALNALKEKYPEADTYIVYKEIVDHYNELEKPVEEMCDFGRLDGLLSALKELKDVLSDDYVAQKKSPMEEELLTVKLDHSCILRNLYKEHTKGPKGQEKIWASMASTVDGQGYVSSSGYGDGGYACYTAKDSEGRIIAIKVDFEFEEDEEDWDE